MLLYFLLLSLFLSASANPKIRVKDSLSEKDHEGGEAHEHNSEYDHEAFLGKDEAKVYDELTPEESKEKLAWVDFLTTFSFKFKYNKTYEKCPFQRCLTILLFLKMLYWTGWGIPFILSLNE